MVFNKILRFMTAIACMIAALAFAREGFAQGTKAAPLSVGTLQGVGGATRGSATWRSLSWQGRLMTTASNGTNTWANSQFQFPILATATTFKVRFANLIQDSAPANAGERSVTTLANQVTVHAAALKLYASGTISSPTTTGASLSTGYSTSVLQGKLIVIINNTNGQQSQIITGQTGNTITVSSWLGGTPTSGASYRIYDWCPITFNGQRTLTMDADALVESDPVPMPVLKGENLWIVTNVYTASGVWAGTVMPSNFVAADMWTETGTGSNVDATLPTATGAWSTTASSTALAPIEVVGLPAAGSPPSMAGVGDSIMYGTGPSNDAVYGHGMGQRYLVALGWPGATGGIPGETTSGIIQPLHSRVRMWFAGGSQYVFSEIGVNDAFNAYSLATTQANYLTLWQKLAAQGSVVIQRTPTPFGTTSTNGWTDAAGQTVSSTANTARAAICAWLRDTSASGAVAQAKALGVTLKIWDVSPYQETGTDNGIWLPNTKIGTITISSATSGGNITVPAGTFSSGAMADVPTNPDRYQVKITSGSGTASSGITGSSGKNVTINNVSNGNTQINLNSSFSVTPASGDTIEIWTNAIYDGTHLQRAGIEREEAGFAATILPSLQTAW
jgi:hypothetical protein